ncbi:hypothetical protein D9M68_912740 [compost metagenome]
MVHDHLGQDLDLGVVEGLVRAAGLDVVDHQLGRVVLDIGLVEHVGLHHPPAGRIEDLLDDGVNLEFEAGLFGQLPLAVLAARLFKLGEDFLHLAVVGLQHGDGVHVVIVLSHDTPP